MSSCCYFTVRLNLTCMPCNTHKLQIYEIKPSIKLYPYTPFSYCKFYTFLIGIGIELWECRSSPELPPRHYSIPESVIFIRISKKLRKKKNKQSEGTWHWVGWWECSSAMDLLLRAKHTRGHFTVSSHQFQIANECWCPSLLNTTTSENTDDESPSRPRPTNRSKSKSAKAEQDLHWFNVAQKTRGKTTTTSIG